MDLPGRGGRSVPSVFALSVAAVQCKFHTGVTCEFGALRPFPQPMKIFYENILFYSILTVIVTATPKPNSKVQAVQDELTTINGN